MTSTVRVEKADATTHKMIVRRQTQQPDGSWVDAGHPIRLESPAELLTLHVWQGHRIVVEEAPPAPAT